MILGIALIVIGAVFLLQNLGYISSGAWGIIWPVIIIAAGLSMICKKHGHCNCGCCEDKKEK